MYTKSLVLLAAVTLFSLGTVAEAAKPEFNTISEPFGVYSVAGDPEQERMFYGELDRYPDTYEITAEESFTLNVAIDVVRGEADRKNFTGIIVRRTEAGRIEEVARMSKATWEPFSDVTGITYLEGPRHEEPLAPGKYRIEVSTPENTGQYRLVMGTEPVSVGYGERLGNVRAIQKFLGYGLLKMFSSPLLQWPLLIVLLLVGGFVGYRVYRSKKTTTLPGDTKFSE